MQDIEISCPKCAAINLVSLDQYGLDLSQLDHTSRFESLSDICRNCQEYYHFDVTLEFSVDTFVNFST